MDDFDLLDEAIICDRTDSLVSENKKLRDELMKAKDFNSRLEKENRILKANISSLYKTALSEIERKTQQLSDVQTKLDDYILRRHRRAL